jgi:hypothetical protein
VSEWRIWVKNFLFSTSSWPAPGPIQPPIQWVPRALTPVVKQPGRESDHSPQTSAEVMKKIHPLPHTLSWCSARLVKHRGNFTFKIFMKNWSCSNRGTASTFASRNWGKPRSSVRITGVPTGVRPENIANTGLERYSYVSHLGEISYKKARRIIVIVKRNCLKTLAYLLVFRTPNYEKVYSNYDCLVPRSRIVELYVYSSIRLHSVVIK